MAATAAAFEARCLVRQAASACLATSDQGQPFASLVTPAATGDLTLLLWLSSLSEHSRHLRQEPRCSLLFTGPAQKTNTQNANTQDADPQDANPQTTPRVTLVGLASQVTGPEQPALKTRWLARHPYASLYANFADFTLWRVVPAGALLVGGFARAQRLAASALLPAAAAVALVAESEPGVVAHMNQDHAPAVARIAARLGATTAAWRLVGVDPDGADLSDGKRCLRLAFGMPISSIAALRQELIAASTVQ